VAVALQSGVKLERSHSCDVRDESSAITQVKRTHELLVYQTCEKSLDQWTSSIGGALYVEVIENRDCVT
jgi:hypothetical protein